MATKIIKLTAKKRLDKKLNVCAYARVSTGKDAMLHSLSAQVSYYSSLIQCDNRCLYVGVYADEAITGTKNERPNFLRMIEDCRAGKIDIIITKSVSRFARNTITLLETIRELKILGIGVYFEEQKIYTLSGDGELLLTILASYAQEEARSVSENMKWRIKKNFQEGKPWGALLYGYKVIDFKYYIVEEEAKVIKLIYELFLNGYGKGGIAKKLNDLGFKTRNGSRWSDASVRTILRNYDYTGNLILQKTYRIDYMCKKAKTNDGELPKYHVEDSHDAIIDLETWNKVQEEIKRRSNRIKWGIVPNESILKGKIVCGNCSKNFLRKVTPYRIFWVCAKYARYGIKGCISKRIDEAEIIRIINEIHNSTKFDNDWVEQNIRKIKVFDNFTLVVELNDGTKITKGWSTHSRKDSWTEEMRQNARLRELERNDKNAKNNSNTTN